MSYLDRILPCQRHDPSHFRAFVVAGRRVGWVEHVFARTLTAFPRVFEVGEASVVLTERLATFDARTEAMAEVVHALVETGEMRDWRNEPFPVVRTWGEEPLLALDRGAVNRFGVPAFGIHLNGTVSSEDGLFLWLGRRSDTSRTDPGKLDHLVAGGQPYGIGLRENLAKEGWEEASLPADLARRAVAVGTVSYRMETPGGLKDDTLFVYDLEVPADFQPANQDGEVEAFERWPVRQVMERVRDSDDFKFNVPLVLLDFFVRRGLLDPGEERDYAEIVRNLHG